MRKYYNYEIIKVNINISGIVFVLLTGYGLIGNLSNWSIVLKNGLNVFIGSFISIGYIFSTVVYWFSKRNEKCMYFNLRISTSSLIIGAYILNICIASSILILSAIIL